MTTPYQRVSVAVLFVLFFCGCKGKLVAIATTPSVSVCIGDNVSLQVDIVGASDKARTLWKCGDHVVEASDYYLISGDGRALFIINSLPPHSGNYTAQVDDGEESATASFNVSIEDPDLRILVENPTIINLGQTAVLKARHSQAGVLWWMHDGDLVRAGNHYRFLDSQDATRTELEISDARREHEGTYEIILKTGGCQIRNVIDVVINAPDEDKGADTAVPVSGYGHSITLVAVLVPIVLFGLLVSYYFWKKSRKTDGSAQSIMEPTASILLEDPFYACVNAHSKTKMVTWSPTEQLWP